jgi:uncharacterized protein
MHLTLHLTTGCNLRCSYCYSPPQAGQGMTLAVAKKALELGRRTMEGSCGVVFFGGEPLLERGLIEETVGYARERERAGEGMYHFKMTTNGMLLDESFIEFSVKNDVLIALSFDGVREAHDQHRRTADGSGTYDTVVEKVKLLLAARPYSSILMVVNPDTAKYLADSVAHVMELGARYIIVSLNFAGPWMERELKVLKKQYEKLGELYIKWTLAGRKFYLSPLEVKLSSHINRHCYQQERCELAERQISVDPAGHLYPCVQFVKGGPTSDWCIGDVEAGVDETAKKRLHDQSQRDKAGCRECAIKTRCNNTCGCLNWQTTGSVSEVSPVLCAHERMLMPIADRVGNYLYKRRDPLFLHKHYNEAYPVLSLLEDLMAEEKDKG